MPSPKTQPARGMRDFLPADVRKREYVIGVIKQVYERYGFEPLETPAVENIETLMGKYGEEGNQLIFKILKRGEHEKTGEADLALRYDLTVPLARVVAQYQNDLPKFFKRYQIQPVWRADRPARGRFREFYQCDVDVLGSQSMVVEAELIAAASDALVALGFKDFTIRLNHRGLLDALLLHALIPKPQHGSVLTVIDKLDKIGIEGLTAELEKLGLDEFQREPLLVIFDSSRRRHLEQKHLPIWNWLELGVIAGTLGYDVLSSLLREMDGIPKRSMEADHPVLIALRKLTQPGVRDSIGDLVKLLGLLDANNTLDRVKIDFSLARGLTYYTGTIMEVGVGSIGSLGGGGRYDNLVGMFLGKDVPACGFSLGLERIIVVMSERGMFPEQSIASPADVMVTLWNEDSIAESIALASELRGKGLRVDLYPEADKLAKQFKYASARGIPYVAIIGEEEKAKSEVAIKDMRSGEQLRLPLDALERWPEDNSDTERRIPKLKPDDRLIKWLRNEGKASEAGDGIKPGA